MNGEPWMGATDNYLREVIQLLMDRASEAKSRRDAARKSGDKLQAAFEEGRTNGYYEVVSTILGQLDTFGIARTSVGVSPRFDPAREIL